MAYIGRASGRAALVTADIPTDSINSDHYVDASIDTAHIGANQVTAAKVAADVATQAELDAQRTNSSITTLGTVTAGNISNAAIVYPAGHVLQCLQSFDDDEHTVSSSYLASSNADGDIGDWYVHADLQQAITPASGNKVLVMFTIQVGSTTHSDALPIIALYRDTTKIGMGKVNGDRIRTSLGKLYNNEKASSIYNYNHQYLDNPSADGSTAYTYKIGVAHRGAGSSGTVYINRPDSFGDSAEQQQPSSSITVMEIAQ